MHAGAHPGGRVARRGSDVAGSLALGEQTEDLGVMTFGRIVGPAVAHLQFVTWQMRSDRQSSWHTHTTVIASSARLDQGLGLITLQPVEKLPRCYYCWVATVYGYRLDHFQGIDASHEVEMGSK